MEHVLRDRLRGRHRAPERRATDLDLDAAELRDRRAIRVVYVS
jgi:hypothetical protein